MIIAKVTIQYNQRKEDEQQDGTHSVKIMITKLPIGGHPATQSL